jgi:hypothetical protein
MKWMKQVFAQRYNRAEGRIGHIWGDRYWSEILEGEPPEGDMATEKEAAAKIGVRPQCGETTPNLRFLPLSPLPTPPPPG